MNNDLLKRFFEDEHMRIEVFKFIKQEMDTLALDAVYKGQDTKGYKEAKDTLVKVEQKLFTQFAVKERKEHSARAV